MGKAIVEIPAHVVWRDGRPRFQPGPRLRALGFKGRDLCDVPPREAHRLGVEPGWWSLDRISAWARSDLAPAIAAAEVKAAGADIRRRLRDALGAKHKAGPTVAEMVAWSLTRPKADGRALAAGSRLFYAKMGDTLAAEAPALWATPARSVRAALVYAALIEIRERRSLDIALGCRALLARAWTQARLVEWGGITENPAADMKLPRPKGRIRSATVSEVRALVATADALGRPDIGDLVVAGVTTAQRRGDRLRLEWGALREGWITLTQQKTGTTVEVPVFGWLAERLEAAKERRRDWRVTPTVIFPNETNRRRFAPATYTETFATVVVAAVTGMTRDGVEVVAPTPSLAGYRDQDLRDTFVTWAIEEGLTAEQIANITGHARRSVQQMVDAHYAARTRPQASAVASRVEEKIAREQ